MYSKAACRAGATSAASQTHPTWGGAAQDTPSNAATRLRGGSGAAPDNVHFSPKRSTCTPSTSSSEANVLSEQPATIGIGAPNKLSASSLGKAMTSAPRQRSGLRSSVRPSAMSPAVPPSAPTTTSDASPKSRESARASMTPSTVATAAAMAAVAIVAGVVFGDSSPSRSMSSITCARRSGASKTASRGNARMSSSSRARASRNARTARPGGQRVAAANVRSPTTQMSSPRGTGGGASSSTASWICVRTKAGATRSIVFMETVATYRGASSPAKVMTRTFGAPVT
mmetsp:Transcript_25185/g.70708  ORF Transcript_25185/g.70708 Transcript_25185/m.70708 type:complete len:285 (-) Transcript_25185:900-1754(-)